MHKVFRKTKTLGTREITRRYGDNMKPNAKGIEIPLTTGGKPNLTQLTYILEAIEEKNNKTCWRSGRKPTDTSGCYNLGLSNKTFILCYNKITNEIILPESRNIPHIYNTVAMCHQMADFISYIPATSEQEELPKEISVLIPTLKGQLDKGLFDATMQIIESIDNSIHWMGSLNRKPTEYRIACGQTISNDEQLIYTVKHNNLRWNAYTQKKQATHSFMDGFIEALKAIKGNNSAAPTKQQDSRWNTKCSKCGNDAYDSGFTFECINGCMNATKKV